METTTSTTITVEGGLAGDSRGSAAGRNVTVLTAAGWSQACAAVGEPLEWTLRRANLLVDGVDLANSTGKRLRIGSVLLQITDECQPCERMEEAKRGLRAALAPDWRAGVTCIVIEAGAVSVGDAVHLE